MRLSLRARLARTLMAAGLLAALLLPAAAPVTAQAENVLRVGTTQDLDSMNPWQTALVVGFEVFTLNYDLLVNFGPDLEPVPGFAESWEQSADGLTWTFKMREGMLWSDGQPATSEDARWTLQFVLDGIASDDGFIGLGYLDPYAANAGVTSVAAPDPTTLVVTTSRPNDQVIKMYVPMLPKHIWEGQTLATIADFTNDPTVVGSGPYQAVEWQTGQFIRFEKNPNYWKELHRRRRGHHPDLLQRRHDGPGAADRAARLRPRGQRRPVRRPQDGGERRHGRGHRQRLDAARLQRLRERHGQDDRGRGPIDDGAPGRGLPRCARLCDRQRAARGPRPRRLRRSRDDERGAVPGQVARRAGQPPHLRPRPRQAEARRGRLRAAGHAAPRQGGQAARPAPGHARFGDDLPVVRPVHPGLVR